MHLDNLGLKMCCNASIEALRNSGKFTPTSKNSGYTFIDNNANVLGVAHIDTVQQKRNWQIYKRTIQHCKLDDRLGVYTLLFGLPSMGISLDILLCEDEEIGQSTAQFFETNKQYNWMVEFDRTGTDVVMYQYETPELKEILNSYNCDIGRGSYTDICELENLGIVGFNFGVGYHKPHSLDAFMRKNEYLSSIKRFLNFYAEYRDIKLEHTPLTYDYCDTRHRIIKECPCCGGIIWNLTHYTQYGVCMDCSEYLYNHNWIQAIEFYKNYPR